MSEEVTSPVSKSPGTSSEEALQEEIRRLRAQVRDLQSELARRPARRSTRGPFRSPEDEKDYDYERRRGTAREGDVSSRALDESSKLIRSLTFATLEQLRLAADIVGIFTDEVFRRNRAARYSERREERYEPARDDEDELDEFEQDREQPRRTASGLASDLPRDLYSGLISAAEESLSIPGRVVDTFQETYRESDEEVAPARPRSEARRERARSATYERESERMKREADVAGRRASALEKETDRRASTRKKEEDRES